MTQEGRDRHRRTRHVFRRQSGARATTITLKELHVVPHPVQKPHSQIWEPLTSPRSIKWAAEHGINGVFIVEPNDRLKKNIDIYYEAAEKAGFPDMLNRGKFKYGWDAQKRRGIVTSRYIHITTPGKEKPTMERAARAMELQFDYCAVVARLDEPMFDPNKRVTAEMPREREIAIQESKQFVIDKIMKMKLGTRTFASSAGSNSAASKDARSRTRCSCRGRHAGHRP